MIADVITTSSEKQPTHIQFPGSISHYCQQELANLAHDPKASSSLAPR